MKTPIVTTDPFELPLADLLDLLNTPYEPPVPDDRIVEVLLSLIECEE